MHWTSIFQSCTGSSTDDDRGLTTRWIKATDTYPLDDTSNEEVSIALQSNKRIILQEPTVFSEENKISALERANPSVPEEDDILVIRLPKKMVL